MKYEKKTQTGTETGTRTGTRTGAGTGRKTEAGREPRRPAGIRAAALAMAVLLTAAGAAVYAEDGLAVSGSADIGFRVSKLGDKDAAFNYGIGDDPIRPTVNFAYTKGDTVFKWQLRSDLTETGLSATAPVFTSYAFGTTYLLDGQFGISAGLIDGALWGSGGKVDTNIDAVTGLRFEVKPAIVEGLSAGLVLPLATVAEPQYYFAELGFGAKYVNDFFTASLGVRLDSDKDADPVAGSWTLRDQAIYTYFISTGTITAAPTFALLTPYQQYFEANARAGDKTKTWTAPVDDAGTKFIWGVVPKLDSLVTGLTAALDGQITGIGTDGLGTKTGFKVGYAAGGLSGSIGAALETFPKEKVKALGVYIDPAISYVVTPWFTPSLEANVTIYSYEDNAKTYYNTASPAGDDLAAFDKFSLTLVTTFTLGNGITIAPRYGLVSKSANAPSIIEDATIAPANWDEGRIEHRVEIRFGYSF